MVMVELFPSESCPPLAIVMTPPLGVMSVVCPLARMTVPSMLVRLVKALLGPALKVPRIV